MHDFHPHPLIAVSSFVPVFCRSFLFCFFFFNDTATTEIYTLSLHDALPICLIGRQAEMQFACEDRIAELRAQVDRNSRSEEHTSELQSLRHLVCRLLLEKKKTNHQPTVT